MGEDGLAGFGAPPARLGIRGVGTLFDLAFHELARNKLRSALTMLGIIIGVACVVAMIAIGAGASKSIQSQISSLGSNFIMVIPGASTQGGARIFTGQSMLTPEDAAAIRNDCPSVAYVSPIVRASAQIVSEEANWGTRIQGAGVEWPLVRSWNASTGAFFSDSEVRADGKVCVLGATVADNLFGNGGAVGQTVRIKNVPFRVIGVLERKGATMMGDQDDLAVVPYTTAMKRLKGTEKLDMIFVSASSEKTISGAQEEMTALLRQRHHLGPGQDSDFTMRSQQEFTEMTRQSSRTLSLLLASAAAISLVVGGIGIMNIMLVSVTERTHEIGLRRAVGARSGQVLTQFLIEAATLASLGGAAGVVLGIAASRLIGSRGGFPIANNAGAILLAFGSSALIGIFFGFYPARKASRLQPVDALRFE
jgi:putative ABC transport system permease protein